MRYSLFLGLLLSASLHGGCATLLKGYEDTVILINAPDSIRIVSHEGSELPVTNTTVRVPSPKIPNKYVDAQVKSVRLRNNKEHTLHLKYGEREKIITVYPTIGLGWGVLDLVCGIFPMFIDMYTGSWNEFSAIDAGFDQEK
jgi:hypothetical protein